MLGGNCGRVVGRYDDPSAIGPVAFLPQKSMPPKSKYVGIVEGSPQGGAAAPAVATWAGPRVPAPARTRTPAASTSWASLRASTRPVYHRFRPTGVKKA